MPMPLAQVFFQLGCLSALTAVGIGAFGAHALKTTLEAHNMTHTYETGVSYQFYHAPGLLVAAALLSTPAGAQSRALAASGVLFTAGTVLFSGSLYALALLDVDAIGIITPFGGVSFILAWICMMCGGHSVMSAADPHGKSSTGLLSTGIQPYSLHR